MNQVPPHKKLPNKANTGQKPDHECIFACFLALMALQATLIFIALAFLGVDVLVQPVYG